MLSGLLIFVGLAIAVIWMISTYNHLSALRQRLSRAWSTLDALTRERHDELTKLLEICSGPLGSAQDTLARLDDARTAVLAARRTQDPEALGSAEGGLRAQIAALLARAESTELASAPAFLQVKERLAVLDAQIAAGCDDYNAVVLENNIAIEQFPQRVVAGIAGLRPIALLEFTAGAEPRGRP